jgi:ribose-phosphate pyrophosphokinase
MLKDKGAESVRAFATHPILSGDAVEKINNSQLIELVVSDSVPLKVASPKIKVLSIADIFAKTIEAVTENKSMSVHFVF